MTLRNYIFLALLIITTNVSATDLDSVGREPKYVASIISRSQKAVDNLKFDDVKKALQVRNIIANRYFKLNDIYALRDTAVSKAKRELTGAAKQSAIETAENQKDAALYKSHFAFPAELSIYLNAEQIEKVENSITYNVVNVTYDAYCDMIPTLKEDEKVQILAWLKEAREFAVDAENSKKKHEWFGKYKGRINNYLSKRGYDIQKERQEWGERVKARGGKL